MSDPWRLDEWNALPDVCGIDGCENDEVDQRGPLQMRDGTIHKLCPEHWVAVFKILGKQADPMPDAHRNPDKSLLEDVAERRGDPDFLARLDRIMVEEKPILDALKRAGD